jgi:hypothetical protein
MRHPRHIVPTTALVEAIFLPQLLSSNCEHQAYQGDIETNMAQCPCNLPCQPIKSREKGVEMCNLKDDAKEEKP